MLVTLTPGEKTSFTSLGQSVFGLKIRRLKQEGKGIHLVNGVILEAIFFSDNQSIFDLAFKKRKVLF